MVDDEVAASKPRSINSLDFYVELRVEGTMNMSRTCTTGKKPDWYDGITFSQPLVLATSRISIDRWPVPLGKTKDEAARLQAMNATADKIEAIWPHIGDFIKVLYAPVARQVHIKKQGGVYRNALNYLNTWLDSSKYNDGVGTINVEQLRTLIAVGYDLGVLK